MEAPNHYTIVGLGIAGTVLSIKMMEKGIPHQVIDSPKLSSSSKVAAGLINPIVLKRLKKVQNSDTFLREAIPFYRNWEKQNAKSVLNAKSIAHIFYSQEEQNQWLEKSDNAAFTDYLGSMLKNNLESLRAPFGLGKMNHTYWLDTSSFIDEHKALLIKKGLYSEIIFDSSSIHEKGKVILCNGHLLRSFFSKAVEYFSPTRGELLIIKTQELDDAFIYHAGVFILPLGNNCYKVGATYHWNQLEDIPTEGGQSKLIEGLEKIFTGKYEIIDHIAGVRPNTRDRKPILGQLDSDLYTFNGLGSRGVLMAPYLADLMLNFLERKKGLPPEYSIERFT